MPHYYPRAFPETFEPIVRKGDNVELIKSSKDVLGYYKVKYIEPLPEKIHDFGAINAETDNGDQEIDDLYMSDSEFAQYRILLLDDMHITVSQPKAKKRYGTKSYVHVITPRIQQTAPHLTQIFVFEDEKIFFDARNPTKYNRLKHRILLYGWRFILEKLASKPQTYTTIPIEGAG